MVRKSARESGCRERECNKRGCLQTQTLAGHQRVPKSEGYLNRSFPRVKKGGTKGEVKRGELVGE